MGACYKMSKSYQNSPQLITATKLGNHKMVKLQFYNIQTLFLMESLIEFSNLSMYIYINSREKLKYYSNIKFAGNNNISVQY